jgi:hypothetical protein
VNTNIKIVTKIVEELNHSNENSDTQKKAAIHNTTVRLAEFFFKEKWGSKVHGIYVIQPKIRSYVCREGRSKNRNGK